MNAYADSSPYALTRVAAAVVLLTMLGVAACGDPAVVVSDVDNISPAPKMPPWAKVAPEQIAEAKKHGVPVAFENDIGMRFVLIPAGTFLMGSPKDEEGRGDDETQHEVTLTKPYYLQMTEITNGQYRQLREKHDSGAYKGHSLNEPDQPAVQVTWSDATGFATRLTTLDTERAYRLPSEAEWEWACQEGSELRYGCAESRDAVARRASVSDRHDPSGPELSEIDDGHAVTAAAGTFAPNGWGLYDLHGNAQEWCADWYGEYTDEAQVDPTGCEATSAVLVGFYERGRVAWSGRTRVTRGSNWADLPWPCTARSMLGPEQRNDELGFRLVSPLPEPSK